MLLLGACAGHTTHTTAEAPRSVTIAATATLHLPPDRAAVTLVFGSTGPDLLAAHETVDGARARFVESAGSFTARVEVGTTQYSTRRPRGTLRDEHTATQTVVVHTAEFDDIPAIMRLGADDLTSAQVRYYVEDMTQYRSRIREMATEAAQHKASELASGFGATLGEVRSIEEGGATSRAFGIGNIDNRIARVEATDSETPAPGAIPLRTTLHVTYALD